MTPYRKSRATMQRYYDSSIRAFHGFGCVVCVEKRGSEKGSRERTGEAHTLFMYDATIVFEAHTVFMRDTDLELLASYRTRQKVSRLPISEKERERETFDYKVMSCSDVSMLRLARLFRCKAHSCLTQSLPNRLMRWSQLPGRLTSFAMSSRPTLSSSGPFGSRSSSPLRPSIS